MVAALKIEDDAMPKHNHVTVAEHYLRVPKCGSGEPVLVLHSWWGLTSFFKHLCDRLAGEGFVALAPDLYGGRVADTVDAAKQLRQQVMGQRKEPAYKFLIRQIEQLKAHDAAIGSRIGVVGCSMGGHWAYWLAQRPNLEIATTIIFYAARSGDYSKCSSTFQCHFAEHDDYVSLAARKKLTKCFDRDNVDYSCFEYPGTNHWFLENSPDIAYSRTHAKLAWDRSIEFLKRHL